MKEQKFFSANDHGCNTVFIRVDLCNPWSNIQRRNDELEARSPVAAVYDRRNDSKGQVNDLAYNGGHRPPLQDSDRAQFDSTGSERLTVPYTPLPAPASRASGLTTKPPGLK